MTVENSTMEDTGDVNRNEFPEDAREGVTLIADGGNAAAYEVTGKARDKRFTNTYSYHI